MPCLHAIQSEGREELRGILGERIKMQPDESGSFLWADYSLGLTALLPSADFVVAGGRYELYSNYALQIQAVAASIAASQ